VTGFAKGRRYRQKLMSYRKFSDDWGEHHAQRENSLSTSNLSDEKEPQGGRGDQKKRQIESWNSTEEMKKKVI